MYNPTAMMNEILTNTKAQEIIDYVSPVYGNSYVGLWIFEAIGSVLETAYSLSMQLASETSPETTDLLLSYWEAAYGVTTDTSLTTEQRRERIIAKMKTTGACTPAKIAAAVSGALGGAVVEVVERTGQNKFTIAITGAATVSKVIPIIDAMKPAHLIYEIIGSVNTTADADVYVAQAATHGITYSVEVSQ